MCPPGRALRIACIIDSWLPTASTTECAPRPPRLCALATHDVVLHAAALVPRSTDLTRVVGREERTDHELAGFDLTNLGSDLFHDADVLVTHRPRRVDVLHAAVRPQVGPA